MNRAVVWAMVVAGASAGSLACSSSAVAQENDSGFYVGGGVGQFNLKVDDVNQVDEAVERLDDSDTSWKAFVGWIRSYAAPSLIAGLLTVFYIYGKLHGNGSLASLDPYRPKY